MIRRSSQLSAKSISISTVSVGIDGFDMHRREEILVERLAGGNTRLMPLAGEPGSLFGPMFELTPAEVEHLGVLLFGKDRTRDPAATGENGR
jgi:hypothetical protein